MHAVIADRHNAVVRPGDLVYNLGDFALKIKWEEAYRFRQRLMGNIYFIRGNHDSVAEEMLRHEPHAFVWMRDLETIKPKIDDIPQITLCHYAMRTWPGSFRGSWELYGHSHGMLPEDPHLLSFDIGVDCWDFAPVSIEQVKQKMAKKMPAWLEYKESLRATGRAE
jgi:calcineurin-like phosphoesterase family protein